MTREDWERGWKGLSQFSKDLYRETYFKRGEIYETWVGKIASKYSDDSLMAKRIKSYIENYWFHPSTPISSDAKYPISCFTNSVLDEKQSIFETWSENNYLGSGGGGIGTSWSNVAEMGAMLSNGGLASGPIPFIKVSDSSTLAVSQGGLRRASQAVYMDVSHPEIMEFLDVRKPTGDKDRRSTNIHHGVVISDEFMNAMLNLETWDLISPRTGEVVETVEAFDLWKKLLTVRIELGEPYIMFADNVNRKLPEEYLDNNLSVTVSNLCSEITLFTDEKHSGVCCLTSMNLEYWDEYKDNEQFFLDIHTFTDNVLQSYIDKATGKAGHEKTVRSAIRERSIGIGAMGFHQYLQKNNLPFGSLSSRIINSNIFETINKMFNKTNLLIGELKGANKLSKTKRNANVTAIAPTASISTLCNLTSQGIDPRVANIYIAKTDLGSYVIKNKFLEKMITKESCKQDKHIASTWAEEQWASILKEKGSVQHLDWMSKEDKEVFKTAYEIDNSWIIDYAGDRTEFIDQSVSTNLFLFANVETKKMHNLHVKAWRNGTKTLYYVRSNSLNRATISNTERECLSCQ